MVFGQIVARLRIDDFGRALACQAAGNAADGRAGHGADRAGRRADAGPGRGAAGRTEAGADDVLAGVIGPAAFDVQRVFGAARLDAHQDAAILDAFFVVLDAFFGNAGPDQRANQAAGQAASAGAGQRCGQRTGHHQADAGQDQRGADRGHAGQHGADGAANAGAHAGAFGCLAAQFSFRVGEVALAGVVRHHQGDIVLVVTAVGDGAVGALGAAAVAEQARDHAGMFGGRGIVVAH